MLEADFLLLDELVCSLSGGFIFFSLEFVNAIFLGFSTTIILESCSQN